MLPGRDIAQHQPARCLYGTPVHCTHEHSFELFTNRAPVTVVPTGKTHAATNRHLIVVPIAGLVVPIPTRAVGAWAVCACCCRRATVPKLREHIHALEASAKEAREQEAKRRAAETKAQAATTGAAAASAPKTPTAATAQQTQSNASRSVRTGLTRDASVQTLRLGLSFQTTSRR